MIDTTMLISDGSNASDADCLSLAPAHLDRRLPRVRAALRVGGGGSPPVDCSDIQSRK
jgi:hypothetical protein